MTDNQQRKGTFQPMRDGSVLDNVQPGQSNMSNENTDQSSAVPMFGNSSQSQNNNMFKVKHIDSDNLDVPREDYFEGPKKKKRSSTDPGDMKKPQAELDMDHKLNSLRFENDQSTSQKPLSLLER